MSEELSLGQVTGEGPTNRQDEAFFAAVRGFTEEPLLGPRQAAFVDAQIERVRTGPAMSDADYSALRDLAAMLGLWPT